MALLSLNNLTFTYAHPVLLKDVTLHIERGERIGLVGRNGAGKSTLLKIINRELNPDDGSVYVGPEIVVAKLDQEVPETQNLSAFQMAAEGFGPIGVAVAYYRRLNIAMADGSLLSDADQKVYDRASERLADAELWDGSDRLEGLLN